MRTREIDQGGVAVGRRSLGADLVRGRLIVGPPIIARHYHVARTLLVKFGASEGLRALDALQLAIALDLKQLGQVSLIVTANQRLCRVTPLAGCPAVNSEKPAPVLV